MSLESEEKLNEIEINASDQSEICKLLLENIFTNNKYIFRSLVRLEGYYMMKEIQKKYTDVPYYSIDFHINNCVFKGGLIIDGNLNKNYLEKQIFDINKNDEEIIFLKSLIISGVKAKYIEIKGLCIDLLSVSGTAITNEFNSKYDIDYLNKISFDNNVINKLDSRHLESSKVEINNNNIHEIKLEGLFKNNYLTIQNNIHINELNIEELYYDWDRNNDYYINNVNITHNNFINNFISDYQLIKNICIEENKTINKIYIKDSNQIDEIKLIKNTLTDFKTDNIFSKKLIISEINIANGFNILLNFFEIIEIQNQISDNKYQFNNNGKSIIKNTISIKDSNILGEFKIIGNIDQKINLIFNNTIFSSDYSIIKNFVIDLDLIETDLGNTVFQNSKLSINKFINSIIGDIKINSSIIYEKPIIYNIDDLNLKANIISQIKKMYFDNNNYIEFNKLLGLELDNNIIIFEKENKKFNAFILKFQKNVSDYGDNPKKIIYYILLGGLIFTILFFISLIPNIKFDEFILNFSNKSLYNFLKVIIISYIPVLNIKIFSEFSNLNFLNYLLILIYSVYYPIMGYLLIISIKKPTHYNNKF